MHAADPEAYHAAQRDYPLVRKVLSTVKAREVPLDDNTNPSVYRTWLAQQFQ